ncbi:putative penicillin-binding protein [Xylariales sp. PMI_506]|nr:putative penicillin-binding protein [Xylariales sp. PMI_506]
MKFGCPRHRALALGAWTAAATAAAALESQKVIHGGKANPLDAAFEKLAIETLLDYHVPGLAIAVVDGDDVWAAGYGNASISPLSPVTPDTLFYAGSTTKAFTASALSILLDSRAYPGLSWDTPLSDVIREDFVLAPEYAWAQDHLTFEDAMSHRTGFPRHDGSLGTVYGPDGHRATVRDFTRSLRHLPMVYEPRTTFRYCNIMFMVVSHAIQTLTQEWLGSVLRDLIWAPLGMNSTYFSLPDALAAPEPLAHGYFWDYKGENGFREIPYGGLDEASGAGGIASTVLDYAKWIKCLVNDGPPLSKAGHDAVRTPRVVPAGGRAGYDNFMSYSLGWFVNTHKGHRLFTHSGGMEAYATELFFFPDLKFGVITMGNTASTSAFAGLVLLWKLIDDKLGVPESERYDWDNALKKRLQTTLSKFDDAAEKLYPERPNPPIPSSLHLEAYTGTYSHPAYQNITLEVTPTGDKLRAMREDMVWQVMYDFEHVTGEFWVVYIQFVHSPGSLQGQLAKAEFRIGVDGTVEAVEIEFMEEGTEGLITFKKTTA